MPLPGPLQPPRLAPAAQPTAAQQVSSPPLAANTPPRPPPPTALAAAEEEEEEFGDFATSTVTMEPPMGVPPTTGLHGNGAKTLTAQAQEQEEEDFGDFAEPVGVMASPPKPPAMAPVSPRHMPTSPPTFASPVLSGEALVSFCGPCGGGIVCLSV